MNARKMLPSTSAELLGDLYESVLSPEHVPAVLRAINAHLDCDGIHLVGWQESTGQPIVSLVTSPHIAVAEKAYLEHYAAIDPRKDMGTRRPLGVGGACHDFFDNAFVAADEFYQDFLIPLGPRYIYGGNVLRRDDRLVHVVFNHLVGRPRFEGDKRDALDQWFPHLARWANQLVQVEGLRQAAALGEQLVDSLDQGLVFFDPSGKLLHANRLAVKLLGDRLLRSHLGQEGASPFASSLEPIVRSVALSRQAVRFRMRGVRRSELKVSVLPLARASLGRGTDWLGRLASGSASRGLPLGADVVLCLEPAPPPPAPTLEHRAREWRLTPAEIRLLKSVMTGASVSEHAAKEGVRESTARTHVRGLLEKSGAASLRRLVAMMGTIRYRD
ncbi:helix-turn-helix transcriptional regulator [Luteibacter sp. 9135]|uniref:helix-turn-helix transcriptional regulator n=1 Tax=Luteibacter sp. 9135 TaxID=1500893 RepID=UPI00056D7940|nr:helix-turn-helix transcriptional regulator [Luteibacter sp. 9135]